METSKSLTILAIPRGIGRIYGFNEKRHEFVPEAYCTRYKYGGSFDCPEFPESNLEHFVYRILCDDLKPVWASEIAVAWGGWQRLDRDVDELIDRVILEGKPLLSDRGKVRKQRLLQIKEIALRLMPLCDQFYQSQKRPGLPVFLALKEGQKRGKDLGDRLIREMVRLEAIVSRPTSPAEWGDTQAVPLFVDVMLEILSNWKPTNREIEMMETCCEVIYAKKTTRA